MSQPATLTPSQTSCDGDRLLEDQQGEITTRDDTLDEAGWQALLICVDQEEGGP